MADDPAPKTSLLSSLPSITTTISQMLTSPAQTDERGANKAAGTSATNGDALASPLSSYLPSISSLWPRRTSVKSAKSAGNTPRSADAPKALASLDEVADPDASSQHSTDSEGQVRKRKRSNRPKTSYTICQAPPRAGSRSKIQVRARPLLQLHKLESSARPTPAFELLPSSILSARFIKAIARFTGSTSGLSPNDLAIVKAERYHAHEVQQSDDDEARDILAVVCGVGKSQSISSKVRIIMEGGVEWEAHQLPSGSYECSTLDNHGLKKTVRWVLKKSSKSAEASTPTSDGPAERKFNFSTISANTRRHPIIAHLTKTGLEVSDTYTLPAPTASADLTTPKLNQSPSSDSIDFDAELQTTTDELHALIAATSIYVALMEGWSTRFRGEDSIQRSSSTRSVGKSVSPSKGVRTPTPSSPRKRPESTDLEPVRRSSLRQAFRLPSRKLTFSFEGSRPNSASSTTGTTEPPLSATTSTMPDIPEADSPTTRSRRRANTTSTVIVRPESGDGPQSWQPAYEDETDDEEEPEDAEHEAGTDRGTTAAYLDKVEKVEERPMSAGTLGAASETSSMKRRNLSGSTYGSFESKSETTAATEAAHKEKQQGTAAPTAAVNSKSEKPTTTAASPQAGTKEKRKQMKQKKGSLRSKLLCGLV